MRLAMLSLILLLAGCSSIPRQTLREAQNWPAGYECDATGACWPEDFKLLDDVRELFYTRAEVNKICKAGPGPHKRRIFACALIAARIVILPRTPPACWTMEKLRRHEHGHIAGVTVHDMVRRVDACDFVRE